MDHDVPRNSSDQHGLKRSRSDESNNNKEAKKFMSATHLYQMFLDGTGSDVRISSLGRTWDLHRLQLSLSPYFGSMFNGQWLESDQSSVEVHIVDPNINIESLNITFESLYKDDVDISSDNVVGVLAASSMFCLDGLVDRCARMMKDKTDVQSVIRFLDAGQLYSQPEVERTCMEWLERHLMTLDPPELLRDVNVQVMSKLVSSNGLFVKPNELGLYNMLCEWLFLQLVPDSAAFSSHQELWTATDNFIKSKADEWGATDVGSFLESDQGAPYVRVFQHVRLQHIVADYRGINAIRGDRIIPEDWLTTACAQQWEAMVNVASRRSLGPRLADGVEFGEAFRGGWVFDSRRLSNFFWAKEVHSSDFTLLPSGNTVSLFVSSRGLLSGGSDPFATRHALCRITVETYDQAGRQVYHKDTGVQQVEIVFPHMSKTVAKFSSPAGMVHIGFQLLVYLAPAWQEGPTWQPLVRNSLMLNSTAF
jgi:BTB/POZ domain-containing protein 13